MEVKWRILSLSCLEGILESLYLQPLATLSPLSNPHKSSVLVPPPVFSPLKSCQIVWYKIDTVSFKTFQEVCDYIYYSGKIFESQNSRLGQSIHKCALISSFDSYTFFFLQQSDNCNTPEYFYLHCRYFPTDIFHVCVHIVLFSFFSMMISPFYAPHSQVSPAPLSTLHNSPGAQVRFRGVVSCSPEEFGYHSLPHTTHLVRE